MAARTCRLGRILLPWLSHEEAAGKAEAAAAEAGDWNGTESIGRVDSGGVTRGSSEGKNKRTQELRLNKTALGSCRKHLNSAMVTMLILNLSLPGSNHMEA